MNSPDCSEMLRKVGLKPTAQRLAVLEYLQSEHMHPTADEVYQGVTERFPSISKATVYNALDALKKAGAVQELTIAREAARYDCTVRPHPHFLCRLCGRLYDIDLPCPVRPGDDIQGHHVEIARSYLYGVCAECSKDGGKRVKRKAKKKGKEK